MDTTQQQQYENYEQYQQYEQYYQQYYQQYHQQYYQQYQQYLQQLQQSPKQDQTPEKQQGEKKGLKRPARKQADEIEKSINEIKGGMYNIWYDRYCGDYDNWRERREAKLLDRKQYRCIPERDAGETRASPDSYFCLFFARGKCVLGADCTYFHRIPNEEDEKRIGMMVDCFGRERHRTNRDDMGGVGSFERNCRTLYVGGIRMRPNVNMEEIIREQFGQFGEIENVRVIPSKAIAFVTYKLRLCAEFAKEAMADQSLGSKNEILNVRWANDDPNPIAKINKEAEALNKFVKAFKEKYPDYYNYSTYMYSNWGNYPNTDHQYTQSGSQETTTDNNNNNHSHGELQQQQQQQQSHEIPKTEEVPYYFQNYADVVDQTSDENTKLTTQQSSVTTNQNVQPSNNKSSRESSETNLSEQQSEQNIPGSSPYDYSAYYYHYYQNYPNYVASSPHDPAYYFGLGYQSGESATQNQEIQQQQSSHTSNGSNSTEPQESTTNIQKEEPNNEMKRNQTRKDSV